ncbi:MAG: tRNA (N(6)-L-threonylcarbamoyladenosine(37)-C(2))-methylthiotransferase MtaB [Deltaproteobacteria bacterium]|nr:tRNA (N(6)-L-threonylcarbamoyladenosine(37)-C(2))-methylthiotransferase MtaB [Candidatus Anaeroferrophillus wilburensis]MBN2889902.1 tRNA (N(6)-L-threonylcarbamoyladenosine(37)-C(2))-methylthiotransferase MtaB [Deltaproteobacteria bacterium]
MNVKIITLGCKLNFYESCALSEACAHLGMQVVSNGAADVIIINSCAVTGKAGMQSRQAVRREIRNNPNARVIMTGCYAQYEPDIAAAIDGLRAVVGNAGKAEIPQWLSGDGRMGSQFPVRFGFAGEMPVAALRARHSLGRTRAFMKIQDGCSAFCSYCIIPYLRGRPRSLPMDDVVAEAVQLEDNGYRELVLTGIHLGQYGIDGGTKDGLVDLLRLLCMHTTMRVRLGSLQPPEISPALLELLCDEDNNLCEHLHLSLQSANDEVLAAMGRPYGQRDIVSLVEIIRNRNSRVTMGADIIVGFPTESRAAFADTSQVLADLPLAYLHVFPYSPRPGTAAAGLPDKISAAEKKDRSAMLLAMAANKKRDHYRHCLNQPLKVLAEEKAVMDNRGSGLVGYSRNYLSVFIVVPATQIASCLNHEHQVIPRHYDDTMLLADLS